MGHPHHRDSGGCAPRIVERGFGLHVLWARAPRRYHSLRHATHPCPTRLSTTPYPTYSTYPTLPYPSLLGPTPPLPAGHHHPTSPHPPFPVSCHVPRCDGGGAAVGAPRLRLHSRRTSTMRWPRRATSTSSYGGQHLGQTSSGARETPRERMSPASRLG